MALRVSDHLADLRHVGDLRGAKCVGEAHDERRLIVRFGLWINPDGTVRKARFRASSCAALIAYADATCALIEAGVAPRELDVTRIRAAVSDVHPAQQDRAALVALALFRSLLHTKPGCGETT